MDRGHSEGMVPTVARACMGSCRKLAGRIEQAREQLFSDLRETFQVPERLFQLALGEADALAWQTGFPNLVFPDLAMEKVQSAADWHARQQSLSGPRSGFRRAA